MLPEGQLLTLFSSSIESVLQEISIQKKVDAEQNKKSL